MIDLHVHTNMSDGELTPQEIIALAKNEGVKVIAITDHDTIDGISQAREECIKSEIEFVPGIELSAIDNGKEVHVLGYYIDEKNKEFNDFCNKSIQKRNERNIQFVNLLNKLNVDISMEEIRESTTSRAISKIHFAHCLLKRKNTTYFREAFKKYFNKKAFKCIKGEFPSVEECIKNIKKAGGVSVLAHPKVLNFNQEVLEEKIKKYKMFGLDGIECYYVGHTNGDMRRYCELANKYNLFVTGGTDYHGPIVSPAVKLGRGLKDNVHIIDYSMVENLRKAISLNLK